MDFDVLHLEIQQVLHHVLVEARNPGTRNIGRTVGTDGDGNARSVDEELRDVYFFLHDRDDFESDADFVGAEEGRGGNGLGAAQDEGGDFGGEMMPIVGEAADLDMAARSALDDGGNAHADKV